MNPDRPESDGFLSDDEMLDAMAAMRAEGEQARASSQELARFYASYYHALVAERVPPDYAAQWTLGLQYAIFGVISQQGTSE